LFEVLDLAVGLVALLVGGVGFLDYVGHLFALFVQLALELAVEVVEDYALTAQAVDDLAELAVYGDGLVEFLVGFVQAVLEDFYLFLEGGLVLGAGVVAAHMVLLLDDLFLEI
jgi:hypothetical protein